jgi:KaiC/GvpD/RAD55 family RecA-like ATPase
MLKIDKKIELEKELLGYCLSDPQFIDVIIPKISEVDKTNKELLYFFKSIEYDNYIDFDLLIESLKSKNIDIKPYIEFHTTDIRLVEYKLREYYDIGLSIKIEKLFTNILLKSKDRVEGLDLITEARDALNVFEETTEIFRNDRSFYEDYDNLVNRIEIERENKTSNGLFSSIFPSFNEATQGLKPGNLLTIAGAYKQGKSNFGIQLMLDFALYSGINVGIFSLEMSKDEVDKKILGSKAGVESYKLRNPQKLDDQDIKRLRTSKNIFKKGQIYVYQKSISSEAEIKTKAKQWKRDFKVGVILVDYIGLITPSIKSTKIESRERELAYISKYLKNMAQELEIPVISLAQLNRDGLKNPSSANLAESIAIARDSDFIFTIYKPVDAGIKKIKFVKYEIEMQDNHFVVTLTNSRHTKSNVSFLLSMDNHGEFREIDTTYGEV